MHISVSRSEEDRKKSQCGDVMVKNGWCPQHVRYLQQRYPADFFETFSLMDKRTHRSGDHSDCKLQRCSFFSIKDAASYEQPHTDKCSDGRCRDIAIPQHELLKVLRAGEVPLISCRRDPTKGLELKVHQRRFGDAYTTISHVWADGLGNPFSNSLPECQVAWLLQLLEDESFSRSKTTSMPGTGFLRSLQGSNILFWMDTFCIPPQACFSDLKTVAIDSMASIYAGSQHVLVLDKELMATTYGRSPSEAMLKIAASVWMTRSWTLQETVLPKTTLFKFANGLFDPSSVFYDAYRICSPGTFLQSQKYTDLDEFIYVWNALAGRATTQDTDLYVVLATSLKFKLRQYGKFCTNEVKMARTFLSYDKLPLSILFVRGPKCSYRYRWLPSQVSYDLLTASRSTIIISPVSVANGDDLQLEFDRLDSELLAVFTFENHTSDFLQSANAFRLSIRISRLSELRQTFDVEVTLPEKMSESDELNREMCIIIETEYQSMHDTLRGALFRVSGYSSIQLNRSPYVSDRHSLDYICPIRLRPCTHEPTTGEYIHQGKQRSTDTDQFSLRIDRSPDFTPFERHSRESLEPREAQTASLRYFFDFRDGNRWSLLCVVVCSIFILAVIVMPIQFWMYHSLRPKASTAAYTACTCGVCLLQLVMVYYSFCRYNAPIYAAGLILMFLAWLAAKALLDPSRTVYMHVLYPTVSYRSFEEESVFQRLKRYVSPIARPVIWPVKWLGRKLPSWKQLRHRDQEEFRSHESTNVLPVYRARAASWTARP